MHKQSSINTPAREYKTSKGWRIILYILIVLLLAAAIGLGTIPFVDNLELASYFIFLPLSACLTTVLIYAFVRTAKEKLIISDNKFCHVLAFSQHELLFEHVKGYSLINGFAVIIPVNKSFKKIKISNNLEPTLELWQFLTENFTSLDALAFKEDQESILQNSLYGVTAEERMQKLNKTKTLCNYINRIAWLVSIWVMFFPSPYLVVVTIGILYPLITLIIARLNTLIRIDEAKNSAIPNISGAFIGPMAALMLRAVLDFNIFNITQLLIPVIVGSALLLLFLLSGPHISFAVKNNAISAILILFGVFPYTAATCTIVNCVLDHSPAKVYHVKVLKKAIGKGRSTLYYLELDKWGPQTTIAEKGVSKSFYEQTQVGSKVTIYYKQGLFKIPWYNIYL